jgi:hypothetical protein
MTVRLHIERLVIEAPRPNGARGNSSGGNPLGAGFGPALEQALARRLGTARPQALLNGGAMPSLSIPRVSLRSGLTQTAIAERIADALIMGLALPDTGGRRTP